MKAFIEERFPTDISIGMRGGPEFSTTISESASGHEYRNANWLDARNRYEISKSITNTEDLEKIFCFFRHTLGKAVGFRFKDHSDYIVTDQFLYEVDGSETSYQLFKNYKLGSLEYRRKITKPVKGTVKLSLSFPNQNYSIDYSTGEINFDKILPKGCKIYGNLEFDVPVRFNADHLQIINHHSKIYAIEHLELIEIKL